MDTSSPGQDLDTCYERDYAISDSVMAGNFSLAEGLFILKLKSALLLRFLTASLKESSFHCHLFCYNF